MRIIKDKKVKIYKRLHKKILLNNYVIIFKSLKKITSKNFRFFNKIIITYLNFC
jgi:hypothetical protein